MSSPSLVGGIVLRAYDLPGAIAFAAAYGLLIPVLIYRLFDKRWRTAVIIQVLCFAIERPVAFSLRAAVAAQPNTESPGLSDIKTSPYRPRQLYKGPPSSDSESHSHPVVANLPPLVSISSSGFWKSSVLQLPSTPIVDDPRRRFWYRRWSEFLLVLYLLGMTLAVIATAHLWKPTDSGWNLANQILRYTSSAIGLVLVLLESATLLWALKNVPHIDQRAVRFLLVLTTLLTIPPLYRLVVMHSTTANIAAPDHQALNTSADKAAFYIFHILPEFTVVFIICFFNVREICQTGFKGDERWRDETPKEREKREKKEQEKARKKAEKKNKGLELELTSKRSSTSNDSAATLA
ncbi:hypothetical protein MVEN_01922900 [Mycena venus]|uniref:Proteophosphoglycan ppg4 n=1 Tax=Mycena venus TaxID=2733690 RepID=A0A8H6XG11_9AGAR|nr:hypothetical protein MVEN_01922900 [Mycena venus]